MAAYYDKVKRTWFCKFRYKDWQGVSRATTKRGFEKKKDALAYEAEFKHDASVKPDITLGKLAEIYMADRKKSVRESTYLALSTSIRNHILPQLANTKIKDITPAMLRSWQQSLKGLSQATERSINIRFSALLNFAVKYYGLPVNPFRITGKTGSLTKRTSFLELEEFNRLLAVVDDDYYKLVFSLLFYGGFRIGELKGLEPADFDFEHNTINVDKQYVKSTHKITPPKTDASIRTVTMPRSIMQDLAIYMERLPVKEHPFRRYTDFTDLKRLHTYLKLAGLPDIGLHGLRHSHASLLIRSGIPVVDIARRLGHSPDMTLKIYAHIYADSGEKIANILENLQNVGQLLVNK